MPVFLAKSHGNNKNAGKRREVIELEDMGTEDEDSDVVSDARKHDGSESSSS